MKVKRMGGVILSVIVSVFLFQGIVVMSKSPESPDSQTRESVSPPLTRGLEVATFGSGCFWCTEAVFQQLRGVQSVISGYSGGEQANPTYHQVCTGTTGHAEVVQITYDPQVVSFQELLKVFWQTHDPTTLNRQGNDVGPQYRSVVLYHSAEQREIAEHYKRKLNESGAFGSPVVTEISHFIEFYPAENYHQNYYDENPRQPYCMAVIRPKVEKFKKVFADKLKPGAIRD